MTDNSFNLHIISGVPRKFTDQRVLEAEALQLGLHVRRTRTWGFSVLLPKGKSIGFVHSRLRGIPTEAITTARDKTRTKTNLIAAGLPVAEGDVFAAEQIEEAVVFATRIGYPVVVKPAAGRKGRGVYANIQSEPALRSDFARSAQAGFSDTRVIVEKHVTGNDFRLFATADEVFSVVQRIPAFIIGDGKTTISKLVQAKNESRKFNPRYFLTKLSANNDIVLLAQQGFDENSIPEVGKRVLLSSTANLSQGGESRECFDITHPSILEVAKAAIRSISGLKYGGVDILIENPSLAIDEQDVAIIEVNATPMLLMHPFPGTGTPRNVPSLILRAAVEAEGAFCREAPDVPECIYVYMRITGKVTGVAYCKWFRKKLGDLELNGEVRIRGKSVEAVVKGNPYNISLLSGACLRGPRRATPAQVRSKPLSQDNFNNFVSNVAKRKSKKAMQRDEASTVKGARSGLSILKGRLIRYLKKS